MAGPPRGSSSVDEAVDRLYHETAARRSDLRASPAAFRRRLTPLLDEGAEPPLPNRLDDLFTACACEEGDAGALDDFERRLMPQARAAIAGVTRADDLIEESVQELRKRLFCAPDPKIAQYSGKGPLWKWLRITATRTALDVIKSASTRPAATDEVVVDHLLRDDVDPEFRLARERYQPLFRQWLREAVESLDERERTLLRLRYVENRGIDQLAIPFRAHRATVARWLQDTRDKILAHVQARLRAHAPRITEGEAQSLWRAVRSQVHFSFARLVALDGKGTPPGEDEP
jgi:RNA polymerase sigma-70 factor (ECF subfamily)